MTAAGESRGHERYNLMNYKFAIEEWLPRFPLEEAPHHYSGDIITGPSEICNNEQLRCEMQDQFDWGPAVPVDIFILADGEPIDRCVTKIGGLPFRPPGEQWPTTDDGTAMFFLAQFNFTDSKDLTGELPGDVLLIFADNAEGPMAPLHFEWRELGLSELVEPEEIPEHSFYFRPCYGHIFRTVSYPDAVEADTGSPGKYPKCRGVDVTSAHHLPQYQATQIGQSPFFIQEDDDQLPGRLLCTLSSVNPNQHSIYPFINRPKPLMPPGKWNFDKRYLMLGDAGCIHFSIDEDGTVHYRESSY